MSTTEQKYPRPEGPMPRAHQTCDLCGAKPSNPHGKTCPWRLWAKAPLGTP